MNKLVRFYNKNRRIIWVVILTLIAIITIIQILNKFAYEKNIVNEKNNEIVDTTFNNNYSVITGQEVKQEVKDIVDEFIDLCNNKDIKNAYEMLSSDCKEVLYPTLDDFTKDYYNKIFDKKKTHISQAWIANGEIYTYKIDFVQDMLATGSASKTSIVDYYTVVKENNEYKLNINKFVKLENIDATKTNNNITINVKRKKAYIDYEIYDIEVVNNTKNIIMLDDLQSTDNIYVEDNSQAQYSWYNHEFLESDITVRRGYRQEISIKFNKAYNPSREVVKMVFANVVLSDNEILEIDIDM